jgi:CpXC protein
MSAARTAIKCPKCGNPLAAEIQQVFDHTQDPDAKARLLRGDFNVIDCPTCHYRGALGTPLVYHDADKELLLTFVPPELGMTNLEQEQVLGRLTQLVVSALPAEKRKAYLLRPQSFLTFQGFVERILEADGITKAMLETQRARSRLAQTLMATDPAQLDTVVKQNDKDIEATVFQLISMFLESAQAQGDTANAERASAVRDRILALTSFGTRVRQQTEALEAAAKDLQALGANPTLDKLVALFTAAPSLDKVAGLTALAWQVMDYAFFQALTQHVDRADPADKERLTAIRDLALRESQRLRGAAQAEVRRSADLLQYFLQATDVPAAIEERLAEVDESFFAILEANVEAAQKSNRADVVTRLEEVHTRVMEALEKTVPPEVRLVRDLLNTSDDATAEAMLRARSAEISDALLDAMQSMERDLRAAGQEQPAVRLAAIRAQAEKVRSLARFGVG